MIFINKIDITGQRFGRLVALFELQERKNNKIYWHCKCDCGNETNVESFKLRNNHTKSCGCLKHESLGRKDLIGMQYGKLIVIKMIYEKYKPTMCLCNCDCGNQVVVAAGSLVSGDTKSCGCLKIDLAGKKTAKDFTGVKYGRLLVIERIPEFRGSTRYRCLCDCGKETIVDGRALTSGQYSCGCYKRSHGEILIENILSNLNIDFISQHRFENCKDKRQLPFDFYLPKENICIEYNGEQHYKKVEWFEKRENSNFEVRIKHDNIKREFCKLNNIKLLEIPYYLNNNSVKELIINTLNP